MTLGTFCGGKKCLYVNTCLASIYLIFPNLWNGDSFWLTHWALEEVKWVDICEVWLEASTSPDVFLGQLEALISLWHHLLFLLPATCVAGHPMLWTFIVFNRMLLSYPCHCPYSCKPPPPTHTHTLLLKSLRIGVMNSPFWISPVLSTTSGLCKSLTSNHWWK